MSDDQNKSPAHLADQSRTGTGGKLMRYRFDLILVGAYVVLVVGYTVACALTVGLGFWNRLGLIAGYFLIFGVMRAATFILKRETANHLFAAIAWVLAGGVATWIGYINR